MSNYQTVRGTKDLFKETAQSFSFIEKTCSKLVEQYGYKLAVTPIFEFASLFARNLGEASDIINKEMYLFQDRGGEELALRPEGTAPIVRMLLSNSLTQDLPAKFYYFGPMFRYERPQKGRQRQFNQFGVEYFGAKDSSSDAMLIKMATSILEELGINNYQVLINSLGDQSSIENYKTALVAFLKQHESSLSEDSQRRLHTNPLRILDSKNESDKNILQQAPVLNDFYSEVANKYFMQVLEYLKVLKVNYKIDTKLVRGLDYYTSTVFEITTNDIGAQDTILAGGRYDNLTKDMGGPKIEAIGFAAGIERLMLLIDQQKIVNKPQVAVVCNSNETKFINFAISVIESIRNPSISIELIEDGDNLSKKLKKVNKRNFDLAIIIGEDEINSQVLTLKDFKSGEQQKLSLADLAKHLSK
ncbi:histidine--tRNA ligase [Rickettsiales bacterium LUAb2]